MILEKKLYFSLNGGENCAFFFQYSDQDQFEKGYIYNTTIEESQFDSLTASWEKQYEGKKILELGNPIRTNSSALENN